MADSRSTSDHDALMERVYDELRRLAARQLSRERDGHTLQPTALVHEAFLRLSELDEIEFEDETRFQVAAAGAIRRVLVDHARGRAAEKRGGGGHRVTMSGVDVESEHAVVDVLALHDALEELARLDARKCRVVELRFFAGLTIQETARALAVGTTTVEDDWAFARSWLRKRLGGDAAR